jgi:hypothetical protein
MTRTNCDRVMTRTNRNGVRPAALALALLAVLALPGAAAAQWATDAGTGNISNTNSGNVGVGTTSPIYKLDVRSAQDKTDANQHVVFTAGSSDAVSPFLFTVQWWGHASSLSSRRVELQTSERNVGDGGNLVLQPRAGFVGIGTAAPSRKLDVTVTTTGGHQGIGVTNTNGRQWWLSAADSTGNGSVANGVPANGFAVIDWTAQRTRLAIDGAGNVGVGTPAPAGLLHVYDTSNTAHALNIDAGGAGDAQQATINFLTLGDGTKTVLGAGTRGWHLTARGNAFSDAAQQNDLLLYSWDGASAIKPVQYWDYATGNVGIGTTSPARGLDVVGAQGQLRLTGTDPARGSVIELKSAAAAGAINFVNGQDNAQGQIAYTAGDVMTFNVGGAEKMRVTAAGDLTVTGNIQAKYQDVAEWVPSSQKLAASTVVVLDTERANQVVTSTEAYDTRVAGVVSERPGIALGEGGEGKVLVATTGRVKVRVDATKSPVRIGDLLVTGEAPGVAMRSEPVMVGGRKIHAPGTIIGKALEPLAGGVGEILVLLSLQ